jgi:phosphoadenosine phosphosulfate reductase
MDTAQIKAASKQLAGKSALEVFQWAVDTFGDELAIGSSLGAEAMVVMDMITPLKPDVPFIFLDTDFHFQDTLDLLGKARFRYKANIVIAKTELSPAEQAAVHGPELYFKDPNRCCEIRKIEPMRRALKPYKAWITGRRRDQNDVRASGAAVEWDEKFGLIKVNPLIDWSWDDVWAHIDAHEVPYNRLHTMGYPSIGCAPCTQPVKAGDDLRAGRWAGSAKTECGLHAK